MWTKCLILGQQQKKTCCVLDAVERTFWSTNINDVPIRQTMVTPREEAIEVFEIMFMESSMWTYQQGSKRKIVSVHTVVGCWRSLTRRSGTVGHVQMRQSSFVPFDWSSG